MTSTRLDRLRLSLALVLALALAACTEQQPASEAPAASPSAPTAGTSAPAPAPAGTGVLAVRVTYAGAPVVETISVNKDVEQCGRQATIPRIVVGDGGGLAHAVVSVTGLEGPPTARKATLDQQGCQFQPHVVAMQTGEIDILNSDGILHNVHTYSDANPPINKAQPRFKKVMTETFSKPEIVKVTCDVHSWMLGWIAVMPHPYFGVTDRQGVARVEGVPAGSHTVEVWHEELGRRTADVTVRADQTTEVVVDFPKAG